MLHKIKTSLKTVALLVILTGICAYAPVGRALAAPTKDASSSGTSGCVVGNEAACSVNSAKCSTAKDTVAHCTDPAASGNSTCTASNCNLIAKYINPLITLLSALVGLVVTISIVIGGIQYSSSAGDPQAATAAKNRIRNAIIALVAFIFLYAFLQFLVPGGIFRT